MRMIKLKVKVEKDGKSEEKEMVLFDIEAKAEGLMNFNRKDLDKKGDRRPLERT